MMFETSKVNIGSIEINNTDNLGSISFGTNFKFNRNVQAKKSQGFGQQHGDSNFRYDMVHFVLDEDILDKMAAKSNRYSKT